MHFIKLAITQYETNGARPAIGADDKWINLDQVVIMEEHLGSNSFDAGVRAGIAAVEHYPCIQLTMSDGQTHLVSLGITTTQAAGMEAIANLIPSLVSPQCRASTDPSIPLFPQCCGLNKALFQ